MSCYRRPKVTGATVFFTVCLARQGGRLLLERIDLLREAVATTRTRRPFTIDAWVVLPDHMHCVWTLPADDSNYSQRWGMIKSRFSKHVRLAQTVDDGAVGWKPTLRHEAEGRVGFEPTAPCHTEETPNYVYPPRSPSKIRKKEAGIWQRRFWEHHIRGQEDYDAHVRYCWTNPVKHGLVERPEDWAFSSIHREIRAGRYP